MDLEQRVTELEKKVAELKGQVQKQPNNKDMSELKEDLLIRINKAKNINISLNVMIDEITQNKGLDASVTAQFKKLNYTAIMEALKEESKLKIKEYLALTL